MINENGTYYIFLSSVPQGIKESEGEGQVVRAETIVGF